MMWIIALPKVSSRCFTYTQGLNVHDHVPDLSSLFLSRCAWWDGDSTSGGFPLYDWGSSRRKPHPPSLSLRSKHGHHCRSDWCWYRFVTSPCFLRCCQLNLSHVRKKRHFSISSISTIVFTIYMSSSYSLGQPLDICRSDTPLDLCFMVRRQDGHLPKSCLAVNYN